MTENEYLSSNLLGGGKEDLQTCEEPFDEPRSVLKLHNEDEPANYWSNSLENDMNGAWDSRNLNSVSQYAKKIRAFVGLDSDNNANQDLNPKTNTADELTFAQSTSVSPDNGLNGNDLIGNKIEQKNNDHPDEDPFSLYKEIANKTPPEHPPPPLPVSDDHTNSQHTSFENIENNSVETTIDSMDYNASPQNNGIDDDNTNIGTSNPGIGTTDFNLSDSDINTELLSHGVYADTSDLSEDIIKEGNQLLGTDNSLLDEKVTTSSELNSPSSSKKDEEINSSGNTTEARNLQTDLVTLNHFDFEFAALPEKNIDDFKFQKELENSSTSMNKDQMVYLNEKNEIENSSKPEIKNNRDDVEQRTSDAYKTEYIEEELNNEADLNDVEKPNELPLEAIKEDKITNEQNLSEEEKDSEAYEENSYIQEDSEPKPPMAAIRRLSVEIVNKVLNNAENQLRDILNEKRNSVLGVTNTKSSETSGDQQEPTNNDCPLELEKGNFYCDFDDAVQKKEIKDVFYVEDFNQKTSEEVSQEVFYNSPKNEIQLKDVLAKVYDANDFQKKFELEMNKLNHPKYDIDPDTVCGFGCFKPKWIQPWATSRVYLVLYSIIGILSGSYYAYLIGCVSTLEKRFAFKSKITGSIMMLDELTPLVLGICIGYYGGRGHRPRMVGFGMMMSSLAALVSALPYFIYGPATHLSVTNLQNLNKTVTELCDQQPRSYDCDSDDRPPTLVAVMFLMLGSFLKGFGNLAYYSIGLAYMDDNAKKKNTPLYLAVAAALRLLGPMLGFLMSSFFLKFYENPFEDPGFGSDDPRWIGGWWMGFVLQGCLLFIFSLPISLFPRRLPGHPVPKMESSGSQNLSSSLSGLFPSLLRLAKNPVFVLLNLNTIMYVMGHFGHYIMAPKYLENQFLLTASNATLLAGPPDIAAIIVGCLLGGYLIWKFRPNTKLLTMGLAAVELLAVIAFLLLIIPTCEHAEMTHYGTNTDGILLDGDCNSNCNCSTKVFSPVCGPDGHSFYFSPCHAGCQESSGKVFNNCSCVLDISGQNRSFVKEGFCSSEGCWSQALAYVITVPVFQAVMSLFKVAHTMIILRSIRPADKNLALGTFETMLSTFGFIPFPILFGVLVDSACLVWEKNCDQTGNCWHYDVSKFNFLLHGASAAFSGLSFLCLLGIYFLHDRIYDLYEEDDADEDENISTPESLKDITKSES